VLDCRQYNGRATVEQRIEEMKNDLNADGFSTKKFFATEAAFLGVVLSLSLLSFYQAGVARKSGYRKPSTFGRPCSWEGRSWDEKGGMWC